MQTVERDHSVAVVGQTDRDEADIFGLYQRLVDRVLWFVEDYGTRSAHDWDLCDNL